MSQYVDLKPGQRVHVLRNGDGPARMHESTIRQVSDSELRLDLPRRGGVRLEVRPEDTVKLLMELHGRLYTFETRVRDVVQAPTEAVVIDMPESVERTERRDFYRLPTMITPRYAALTNRSRDELGRVDAVIVDISGGGVRLRSHTEIPVGAWVRLIFSLADDPADVDVTFEALSVEQDGRRGPYRVHGRYLDSQPATEERIVRFIFSQQVQLLQQGSL